MRAEIQATFTKDFISTKMEADDPILLLRLFGYLIHAFAVKVSSSDDKILELITLAMSSQKSTIVDIDALRKEREK